MKEKGKRLHWIGWIYAAVLVMIALAGIIYCSNLNRNSDAKDNVTNYAVEKNTDEDSGVLSENADADNTDVTDTGDIIDMGDISTEVPLGDVTE